MHLTKEQIDDQLPHITASPKNNGLLELIVRRPKENEREVINSGELSTTYGLVGDTWINRTSSRLNHSGPHPEMQINIINSRLIACIAQEKERWKLAGDQLYVDLDLSKENLPAGTKLKLGNGIIEVTAQPHTGCAKFIERFGKAAMIYVNSEIGKRHQLRGINAKVIQNGTFNLGDKLTKINS